MEGDTHIYEPNVNEYAKSVLMDIYKVSKGSLSRPAFNLANQLHLEQAMEEPYIGSGLQLKMISSAKEFLVKIGYEVTAPIYIVDELPSGAIGQAKDMKICLASRAFDLGYKQLIITLLEEHLHVVKNFADESRAFQDYLLTKVVSLGQIITNEVL